MKITVDRDRCVGAGMCALTSPALFDQSPDDGRVILRDPSPGPDAEPEAREAAEFCPSGAITVTPP